MAKTRILTRPDWLTLLSAALIVAAFPPWNLDFLAWFCLVPWLVALHRAAGPAQAFAQGVWLSFFMSLGGFYWVASALHQFGGLPWPLSILGLLLFGLGGQPQFLLMPLVLHWLSPLGRARKAKEEALSAVFAALAYAGLDWLLPKLFADTLGHAFYQAPRIRQLADLGGAHLITFLVFLVNDLIARAWLGMRERKEPSLWPLLQSLAPRALVTLALCAAALLYGHARQREIRERMASAPLRAQGAAIQGNIGDFDKIAAERGIRGAAEKVLSTYFSLSDRALALEQKPEFLLWPETAYPSTFRSPNTADELFRDQKMESFVRDRGVPLLFGGYDRFKGKDFNALFLLAPGSDPELAARTGTGDLQIYRKNVLLLFGEYIPGAEWIKLIRDTFPQVGNFGRGVGPEVLRVPLGRASPGQSPERQLLIGPIICYEALFPSYVIEAANQGSQLILNITNDSWFGPFGEPHLHLALAAFRSIETRLPQLRSTNTGISALILPDGTTSEPTPIGETAILNVTIPVLEPVPTLLKAWGDWFGAFALLSGGFGLLALHARRGRETAVSLDTCKKS
ncbi:MAG: apolipoprotein N-acyltransferase [Oligoflexia bacterium]|nr:apolipoprotein N-acyltransferase [Oligoflexia bacterium]